MFTFGNHIYFHTYDHLNILCLSVIFLFCKYLLLVMWSGQIFYCWQLFPFLAMYKYSSILCLANIFFFSIRSSTSEFVHICVSIYNVHDYQVLNYSHKYFTFHSHIWLIISSMHLPSNPFTHPSIHTYAALLRQYSNMADHNAIYRLYQNLGITLFFFILFIWKMYIWVSYNHL